MGGGLSVLGHHGPLVFLHHHVATAHDHHGLDGDRHARAELEIAPALFAGDEIGDRPGLLVHAAADAVPDKFPHHAVAVDLFHVVLHEPGDLAPALAGLDVADGHE